MTRHPERREDIMETPLKEIWSDGLEGHPLAESTISDLYDGTAAAILGGEQPDSPALPTDGALRGDVPLSNPSESDEVL